MPRRRPSSASHPSERLLAALASIELPDCNCKLTMLPVCIVRAEPGCRERRRYGTCPCCPRWLPECLLDEANGCELHRLGKQCKCDLAYMPECLALGCRRKRLGRICECPRWPGEPCEHVIEKARQIAIDSPAEAEAFASAWANQLWEHLPAHYRDRPLAGRGVTARAGRAASVIMAMRESLQLSLWHPEDERWPDNEQCRRIARGMNRLLGRVKGGG